MQWVRKEFIANISFFRSKLLYLLFLLKKLIMKQFILFILSLTSVGAGLHAQALPKYLENEKWIRAMSNDSSANFFEAEASFRKFYTAWQEKIKERDQKEEKVNNPGLEEEHMKEPEDFFISRYRQWSMLIKPFVLANGHIMPVNQRLSIIQEARDKQKQ
jgi:hypothetical protein